MEYIQIFIGFFGKAGETFMSMAGGIIPMLIALLIVVNTCFRFIGQKRMDKVATLLGKNRILAYGILPPISWLLMSFPGALTIGKLLPEKNKLGYQDALVTTAHPLTSLFPHVLPSELFIWLGVSAGITQLGLPVQDLAIRFIAAAICIGIIRGFMTDAIHAVLKSRAQSSTPDESESLDSQLSPEETKS
ncbi:PTS glucitol/sorbitol transporter subunit IIC [Vibrio gazogenes]|uniref:PTS system, glucitol/sorbitol-specific IIC component n=1 Tax=Vibrio gazogenes DSM 21264 = NBRC 103151 TaxID=1123492 RepID=A0A1M5BNV5_VIBGA|nr:PTS glucitol/sorbitol transporter subunit IIC [Vibrio gazogenes]USP13719.1 PTS glucitol/sorbitol transporter subunit IIC [Vibrio gazogenes]SHF44208.1 PTS system, glucitol/sorbitol-specific IIC component [Vibrio gazogenes DSM 21264] [Vibrio gazogenes DSM 21264 = NBRC 103151]SJN55444.1 Glucitol/sorbitol permease IIC component [Vibrio gazogenes]